MPWLGISVGLLRERSLRILTNSGLIPPCMQSIFSSMTAAIGMALKVSTKFFQIFTENFRLPAWVGAYTRRRSRRAYWSPLIRGCRAGGRSSRGTWPCRIVAGQCSTPIASPDLRSLPGRGNSSRVESLRSQRSWVDLGIAHGCRLQSWWALLTQGALVAGGRLLATSGTLPSPLPMIVSRPFLIFQPLGDLW